MPTIGFFKAQPTEYVLEFVAGSVRREGLGLAFFYLPYKTQVVVVPTSSRDANFVFNEVTSNFQAAKPTPEVAKALEAEYRETLLRQADEAIYARRAAAVEAERTIKEKELNTQITLEEQRRQLIDLEGRNAAQEADYRGQALEQEAGYRSRATELELGAYRILEPRALLALAMKELGENAGQIGNLTITSERLAALLNAVP